MIIDRINVKEQDGKILASFNLEDGGIEVVGNKGRVNIRFESYTDRGVNHLHRLSLSKPEAILLLNELYDYLEPDLKEMNEAAVCQST